MTQETLVSSGTPTSMFSGVLDQNEVTATIKRGDIHPSSIPMEVTAPIPVLPPVLPVPDEAKAPQEPAESEVPGVYTVQEEDEDAEENTEM
ncbi:hypothetical protein B7P43_G17869 [Cryptotermes secundus]|uniref:Uncharacterized protein n=1 Tax=Cryptotermes secundus TaxID=105785 RepID=A0A2J7RCY8_9NEOP|nr:hypothetical protein B7P43_G17869 [Cryptotermes secundus]